jgi:hypothetical protein
VDSLHVKRIDIKDLVSYVYIVRVDTYCLPLNFQGTKLVSLDPYRLKTFVEWDSVFKWLRFDFLTPTLTNHFIQNYEKLKYIFKLYYIINHIIFNFLYL